MHLHDLYCHYCHQNLQTLGMPLSLVSLTGLVAGSTATVVLPIMGCYGDRGPNPAGRRKLLVVLSSMLMLVGLGVITTANVLYLSDLGTDSEATNHTHPTLHFAISCEKGNSTRCNGRNLNSSFGQNLVDSQSSIATNASPNFLLDQSVWNVSDQFFTQLLNHSESSDRQSAPTSDNGSSVPFTAGLGMLGYIILDISFDSIVSNVKTWMLMCSPSSAPTPTLVAGLVTTSLGGMLSSGFGMVDLAAMMGLSTK